MAWRRLPMILLACALATGTASCGAGSEPGAERDEPPVNQLKTVTDLKQLVLPLNSYQPTQAEEARLAKAGNVLFRQCMRRFGFELGEPPLAQPPPFAENERRYGLVDEERAGKIGYDAPEIDQRVRPVEPEISAEAKAVAEGKGERTRAGQQVPDGGCLGEARRKLAEGTAGADDQLVVRLGDKAGERAEQDSRVRKAFGDWSACMKRAGYDYAGPWQAHDNPEFTDSGSSEREIATAVADTRCKRETNLINIWVSVETAYQERVIGSHTEELDRVKSSLLAQLRNADRVLTVP
jgi:hypothetical protein